MPLPLVILLFQWVKVDPIEGTGSHMFAYVWHMFGENSGLPRGSGAVQPRCAPTFLCCASFRTAIAWRTFASGLHVLPFES